MAPTNLKTAVLMGRTGSGKSTIANMLVTGELNPLHKAEMGDGLRGTTVSCSKLEGRVPDEEAREVVIKFLREIQGEYGQIICVKERKV